MDPRSPEFQRTLELQYQVGGVRRSECYERTPSGLENSKTSKHKTKPTFKTYPFHLMSTIFMSFTL